MSFASWIAFHFRRARRSPRAGRLPSRRYRPTVKSLEDRLAPAILTVNTLVDSTGGSQLSLRDAILAVDSGGYSGPATGQVSGTFGSSDTILFQSGLHGTLSLTSASGPLVISVTSPSRPIPRSTQSPSADKPTPVSSRSRHRPRRPSPA